MSFKPEFPRTASVVDLLLGASLVALVVGSCVVALVVGASVVALVVGAGVVASLIFLVGGASVVGGVYECTGMGLLASAFCCGLFTKALVPPNVHSDA